MNYNLSVSAEEFVPKIPTLHRPLSSTLSAEVAEFIPRSKIQNRHIQGQFNKSNSHVVANKIADQGFFLKSQTKGVNDKRKLRPSFSLEHGKIKGRTQKVGNEHKPGLLKNGEVTSACNNSTQGITKSTMSWSSIVKSSIKTEQTSQLSKSSEQFNKYENKIQSCGTRKKIPHKQSFSDQKCSSVVNKQERRNLKNKQEGGNLKNKHTISLPYSLNTNLSTGECNNGVVSMKELKHSENSKTMLESKQNSIHMKPNNIQMKQNSIQTKQNDIQMKRNNFQMKKNSTQTKQNSIQMKQNDIQMKQNSTQAKQSSIQTKSLNKFDESSPTKESIVNAEKADIEKHCTKLTSVISLPKKKLIRTSRASLNGYSTEHKSKVERTVSKDDFSAVRNLVQSYCKIVEKGCEPYRVSKSKVRQQEQKHLDKKVETTKETTTSSFWAALNEADNKPTLSYSAVLKTSVSAKPKQNVEFIEIAKNVTTAKKVLTEDEIRERKHQKVLKRKLKVKQKKAENRKAMENTDGDILPTKSQSAVKQSQKEIKFDIGDMFDKLLSQPTLKNSPQKQKKKITFSTGVVSVMSGLAKRNTPNGRRLTRDKYNSPIIDDNTTIHKRGKERETPKKKKPTLLKKIIRRERERRKMLAAQTNIDQLEESSNMEEPKDVDLTKIVKTTNNELEEPKPIVQTLTDLPEEICNKIHSRKFREYCNHILTKDINNLTYSLLVTLQKFQDRVYHESPAKYKQKRRFVLGLREVLKHLKLKRLKAVIIAPNMERISSQGGIDHYLVQILNCCKEFDVAKIFAMNRHTLGRTIKKGAPVSVIGIFYYDGAQDIFKELMEHVENAQIAYKDKVNIFVCTHIEENREDNTETNAVNIVQQNKEDEKEATHCNEAEEVKQQILNRFEAKDFRIQDDDSDAWVTDNDEGC